MSTSEFFDIAILETHSEWGSVKEKTVAVVMPAFNEEIVIGKTLADFAENLPNASYFVIDNNSTDKTSVVALEQMKAFALKGEVLLEPRQGKALAVRKAFQEIDADVYLLVDADSTYLAEDAQKLIDLVTYKSVDMAVGNRHENQAYEKIIDRKFHQLGNTLMRKSVNFLFQRVFTKTTKGVATVAGTYANNGNQMRS